MVYILMRAQVFAGSVGGFIHNDVIFGVDQHYTNAVAFGWMSDELNREGDEEAYLTNGLISIVDLIPFHTLDTGRNYTSGIALNQYIITPAIDDNGSVIDGVPFAGTLRMAFQLNEYDRTCIHSYVLSVGVTGPSAQAEEVQNGFHEIIGSDHVNGWDSQLGDKFLVAVGYAYGNRTYEYDFWNTYEIDWFNNLGFTLGNTEVSTEAGTLIRIGNNVPDNFVFASQLLGADGREHVNVKKRNDALGWSLSIGLFVSAEPYNYILEEAKKSGIEVNSFSGGMVANASIYIGDFQAAFTVQQNDLIIKQKVSNERFGGLTFIWAY